MTSHETELFQEELEEELLLEFSYSHSQCTSSSFSSQPLDLSMRPWFDDGINYPFRESVSYVYIVYDIC